jgi:hypothetical protein
MLRYCLILLLVVFIQCKKQNNVVCTPLVITVNTVAAPPCTTSGSITITSPTGGAYRYKVNSGPYQSSTSFSSLRPGTHTVTIKEENGCESSAMVTVPETTSGPLFAVVKNILLTNCTPCHVGHSPMAGLDWKSSCDILQFWDRIKARAIDGNPSPMPQAGLLPLSEINKIMDWINAGHRYSD